MSERHLNVIRKILQAYADRGVFQGYKEKSTRAGKTTFEFGWLTDNIFNLIYDEKTGRLTMKDVLPNMPPKSYEYKQLKAFVEQRKDPKLPAHRRMDPGRAEVSPLNRKQTVSLVVDVKRNQYTYALKRLLNLVNELWNTLDQNYMWANFDIPEE